MKPDIRGSPREIRREHVMDRMVRKILGDDLAEYAAAANLEVPMPEALMPGDPGCYYIGISVFFDPCHHPFYLITKPNWQTATGSRFRILTVIELLDYHELYAESLRQLKILAEETRAQREENKKRGNPAEEALRAIWEKYR